MGIGAKIGWSAVLVLVGAVGNAALKEFFGPGQHRAVWMTLLAVLVAMLWVPRPFRRGRAIEPPEAFSQVAQGDPTGPGGRQKPAPRKFDKADAGAAAILALLILFVVFDGPSRVPLLFRFEQTLHCQGNDAGPAVNVVVTSGWLNKPTIRLTSHDSSWTFNVTEISATHYIASDDWLADYVPNDVAGRVYLDRLSGHMRWQWTRFQKGQSVDDKQCVVRGVPPEHCASYKNGTHSRVEYACACREAVTRF